MIKIELEGSNPVIWRRVVMPADVAFNRLHDTIQHVTNFQSGYPTDESHPYEFELPGESVRVTNDVEAHEEHQGYLRNRAFIEDKLQTMSDGVVDYEEAYQKRLKVKMFMPTEKKIDEYLERLKVIRYNYKIGAGWWFTVTLEEIVEDYYFGFPTLLDGRGTAPPEGISSIREFYRFIEIYRNEDDPEHREKRRWASSQAFEEYNDVSINERLKWIKYQETEWDKIDHENYHIKSNKYRTK